MSMPVIDAVVRADRPFVIQGYGKTYEFQCRHARGRRAV